MKTRILITIIVVFWASVLVAQNNVGIGTASPAAKLDVRGNGISYDVFNASNDRVWPIDSILAVDSRGRVGIGTNTPGPYALKVLAANSAFQYQVEVWDNDPALSASRMVGDIMDAGGQIGMMSLYMAGNKRVQLRANGSSYLNGGFVGIGISVPKERLHLNGAVIVGLHFQPMGSEIAGTIDWDGTNFRGFNGINWINLDVQNQPDIDWQIIPSGWPPALGNPELVPMMPPASISMSFPGEPNQGGIVWIPDRTLPGIYPHQLMLESTTNALLSDASMLFRMSDWSLYPNNPPLLVDDYSVGIFRGDMSFKIYRGSVLAPTTQGDNNSMFRANASGIIDLPNQSRVRAYQTDQNNIGQLIQPNTWTPVNFNNDAPLAPGYDEQNEFTTSANAHILPAPPENAWFTAMKDGYYQVNARCEFDVVEYFDPQGGGAGNVIVGNGDWITIAIYVGAQPGVTNPYAWGNILQIGYNSPNPLENKLWHNNAPNISDVVYLQAGQILSIWVYQTATTPMNLIPGPAKLYVSIHKVS